MARRKEKTWCGSQRQEDVAAESDTSLCNRTGQATIDRFIRIYDVFIRYDVMYDTIPVCKYVFICFIFWICDLIDFQDHVILSN